MNIYWNWTPKCFAAHKGSFTAAKYIQHSAWVSLSLFHRQLDIVCKWTNRNPSARY